MIHPMTFSTLDQVDYDEAEKHVDKALQSLLFLSPQTADVAAALKECREAIRRLRRIQRRQDKRREARTRRGSLLEG